MEPNKDKDVSIQNIIKIIVLFALIATATAVSSYFENESNKRYILDAKKKAVLDRKEITDKLDSLRIFYDILSKKSDSQLVHIMELRDVSSKRLEYYNKYKNENESIIQENKFIKKNSGVNINNKFDRIRTAKYKEFKPE